MNDKFQTPGNILVHHVIERSPHSIGIHFSICVRCAQCWAGKWMRGEGKRKNKCRVPTGRIFMNFRETKIIF